MDRLCECALAFCASKPIQWEAFKAEWMASHPELSAKIVEAMNTLPNEKETVEPVIEIGSLEGKPITMYIPEDAVLEPKKKRK